jgi:dihydroxyacetone kinase
MQRGSGAGLAAARDALQRGAGAGTVLDRAADAWSDRAGGTSGALWGAALTALGGALGDTASPTSTSVVAGVDAATKAILGFGATPGDKTMVDAIVPFNDALALHVAGGVPLGAAWASAADAASVAADATSQLLPRMGRARPHAEKSLGTPDAGAASFALIVQAIAPLLARTPTDS